MKLKLPKIKFSYAFLSLKYISLIIIVIIIGFVAILGHFLYTNFYQTIAQSQEVILLKQEVAPDTIDIKRVERVLKALDEKTTATPTLNLQEVKNPFSTSLPQQPIETAQ